MKSLLKLPLVSVPGMAAKTSARRPPALYFLMYLAVGLPKTATMTSSWFSVSDPGRKGFQMSSSAKMHPIDHMSTAVV